MGSHSENEKKMKAIELMLECSNQFPNCPVISTNEIISLLDKIKEGIGIEKKIDNSPCAAESLQNFNSGEIGLEKGVAYGLEILPSNIMPFQSDSESNMILVDVRSREERAVSMVPGAITSEEFESLIKCNPEMDKSMLIIPYCTIGYRSGKYGSALIRDHGFKNVRNGEGIVLWTYAEGSSLVRKKDGIEESTHKVHTFGSAWDLAADKYSTVQFGTFSFIYQGLSALL